MCENAAAQGVIISTTAAAADVVVIACGVDGLEGFVSSVSKNNETPVTKT